jgi:uncharacterized membrane-anchored protein
VTLQTEPVDPRDLFRGDYVTLSYDISRLPAGALKDQRAGGGNPIVYVKLAPDQNGIYQPISVQAEPVAVESPPREIVSATAC